MSMMDVGRSQGADQDLNSTQQNIARQIGLLAQAFANAAPSQTTTTSPAVTGINNLGTATITTVIGTSSTRHGILFHNPGSNTIYVLPSLATAVTSTVLGGSFVIYPGGTLAFPSTVFANTNCAWSGFAATGTSQPLTIVEFH